MTLSERLAVATAQEKRLLAVLALVLAVALPAQLVVLPMLDRRADLHQRAEAQRVLADWLAVQAGRAETLRAEAPAAAGAGGRLSLAALEASLLESPVADGLSRLAPGADGGAEIRLTDVAYTDVMTWLTGAGLGGRVTAAEFRRTGADRVDVALRLAL